MLPTLLLPHFLQSPVSASLRSLCSPLGVADHRRRGGTKLRLTALTPLHRFAALILANLQHSLWHIQAQICTSYTGLCTHNRCEQRIRIQTDSGCTVCALRASNDIVLTRTLAKVRTISVQNNKAKSDLSISTMHMDNSYLGLQQQTASCNAPSIKKTGSISKCCVSLSWCFARTAEQCQVQRLKKD